MSRRRLIGFLVRLLLLLIMLLGAIHLMQDRLLHYPEPIDREIALALAKDLRLMPWPDAGEPRAWVREPSGTATARGTIVLFHGNAGHALHRSWFADELGARGYRTVLAEYPGYGHRSGAMDEASLATDAVELIAAIRRRYDGPLILAGESLGAAVAAAALARDSTGISAVMLMTPWNDLGSVAAYHYPILPAPMTRLILRDRYDSVANLKDFTGPKLVLIAGRDSIIPARLGHALFNALGMSRKLLELPNSDHNDWTNEMCPAMWQEALTFIEGR